MTIINYNPWSEMNSLQRQLNRVLDDVLTPSTISEFGNLSKVPTAELVETTENLILRLEMPGIDPKDLDIEATAKSIAISGERKQLNTNENIRSEFHYGAFQRVIPLPSKIQNTQVSADYQDGIITLTLPKAEAEKNKVVKVNFSNTLSDLSEME